eukprot:c8072_g1_i1.p1 GENE.c8072_g1_i1~~c8072_g1_i1.p1  ORF type:complete len:663 (-),score=159.13 c8072_g1_i1:46-2034(-)
MLRHLVTVSCLVSFVVCTAPSTIFSEEDANKVANFLQSSTLEDPKSVYEAAKAFSLLGRTLSKKDKLCSVVQTLDENDFRKAFYSYTASSLLSCDELKPSGTFLEKVTDAIDESEDLRVLAFAVPLYVQLAEAKLLKIKKEALQSVISRVSDLQGQKGTFKFTPNDDETSLVASAFAWRLLSVIAKKVKLDDDDLLTLISASEAVPPMLKAAESNAADPFGPLAIVDKSASSLLLTSYIVVAIKELSEGLALDLDVLPAQVNRLAAYLLSQKQSYQTVAEASSLVQAVFALSSASIIATPLTVTLQPATVPQANASPLTITVTNIFGKGVGPSKVLIVRAVQVGSSAAILSNQVANARDENSNDYTFSLPKTEPGLLALDISVTPTDNKLSPVSTTRTLKVTTAASISATVSVRNNDASSDILQDKLKEGDKLKEVVSVSARQTLSIALDVLSSSTNKAFKPHQTFALFEKDDGTQVFFALKSHHKQLIFHLNVDELGADFDYKSAKYRLSLIIADANLLNPILWDVGIVDLTFPAPKAVATTSAHSSYEPLPIIEHVFRQPERRPSLSVSSTFTALIGVPAALLLILLLRIGFNFSGVPGGAGGLSSLIFVGLLGSLAALSGAYWVFLSVFQTINFLAILVPVTAVVGSHALTAIQNARLR